MSKIDPKRAWSTTTVPAASAESENAGFDELLTVGEVAGLLKVSRSWVYEHTRARGMPKSEQLP